MPVPTITALYTGVDGAELALIRQDFSMNWFIRPNVAACEHTQSMRWKQKRRKKKNTFKSNATVQLKKKKNAAQANRHHPKRLDVPATWHKLPPDTTDTRVTPCHPLIHEESKVGGGCSRGSLCACSSKSTFYHVKNGFKMPSICNNNMSIFFWSNLFSIIGKVPLICWNP